MNKLLKKSQLFLFYLSSYSVRHAHEWSYYNILRKNAFKMPKERVNLHPTNDNNILRIVRTSQY